MLGQRDLIGYAGHPPHPHWPNRARVAVQFVLNIEEGAERSIVNGDAQSEEYLHELLGRPPRLGTRDWSVESLYEFGSRSGIWRILELFQSRGIPLTAFACGLALELNPAIGQALNEAGHEVAGHGYRWIDYRDMPEAEEQHHIRLTIEAIERHCGKRPVGWYTGRKSENTHRLIQQEGGFLYSSDAYNDELPYWHVDKPQLLMIPYTLINNDVRYLLPNGFACGDDFFRSLKDAFDLLWQEGAQHPKMLSVGLHARISGHPARAMAVAKFLDYLQQHDSVWICRREDIARHWFAKHSPV